MVGLVPLLFDAAASPAASAAVQLLAASTRVGGRLIAPLLHAVPEASCREPGQRGRKEPGRSCGPYACGKTEGMHARSRRDQGRQLPAGGSTGRLLRAALV